jgi:hypothetical protein
MAASTHTNSITGWRKINDIRREPAAQLEVINCVLCPGFAPELRT